MLSTVYVVGYGAIFSDITYPKWRVDDETYTSEILLLRGRFNYHNVQD